MNPSKSYHLDMVVVTLKKVARPYHNGIIHNVINVIYLQGSEGVFFTLVTQKSSKTFKLH
jgi:hypothetical protein